MQHNDCDVLIIGGGMAGGCLARQLKIAMPDLKIVVVEKKKEFDYWIGESTVEVWTDYAYRLCKLGPYLHKYQNLKTGLRFFFDSKEKDLPFARMSENGRSGYVSDIVSHQLDRATFDRDLCELNREIGIEVLLGTRVLPGADGTPDIVVDGENGHVVNTDAGRIRCKWLVDAGGRTAPLAQKLKLVTNDERHPLGSYWGRFTNFADMDEMGGREWKKRVEYTLRYLSTNHFMYPGYWIWVIPVTDKILSIGVCFRRDMRDLKMRGAEDLFAFLREHQVFRDLLPPETKALDYMGFRDCTRIAKQFFSTDRWFMTGMSGFVQDALYSTTGRTASIQNRLIGELIRTDRSGDKKLLAKQVQHFNIFARAYYELIQHSISTYDEFGSFDLWTGWRIAIQSSYFNVSVPQSTEDLESYFEKVKSHGDDCGCSIEKALNDQQQGVTWACRRLLTEMYQYVSKKDLYYTNNKDGFTDAIPRRSLSKKTYEPRDMYAEFLEDLITFEASYRNFLTRMSAFEKVPWNETAFNEFFIRDWHSGQTLEAGLTALRSAQGTVKPERNPAYTWSHRGPVDEFGEEMSPSRYLKLVCGELPSRNQSRKAA